MFLHLLILLSFTLNVISVNGSAQWNACRWVFLLSISFRQTLIDDSKNCLHQPWFQFSTPKLICIASLKCLYYKSFHRFYFHNSVEESDSQWKDSREKLLMLNITVEREEEKTKEKTINARIEPLILHLRFFRLVFPHFPWTMMNFDVNIIRGI